jgi:hypothetical protein
MLCSSGKPEKTGVLSIKPSRRPNARTGILAEINVFTHVFENLPGFKLAPKTKVVLSI